MAERLLSRPLRPEERGVVKGTLDDMLSHFRADPAAATALLAVGEKKPDPCARPAHPGRLDHDRQPAHEPG